MPILTIRRISWCALLLSAWLSGACCAGAEPLVAFGIDGGEAWTFEKTIHTLVPADRCEEVAVTSPIAPVVARTSAGRAVATVPLAPGPNPIDARCRQNGVPSGTAARQHWLVRLRSLPQPLN